MSEAAHRRRRLGGNTHDAHPALAPHSIHTAATDGLLSLLSPRVLFSICLGLGTAGLLARNFFGEPALFGVALAGGILFERLLVAPIWNFGMRFESNPALTLESAVTGEATAVSNFDANGQGLISVEVDGQVLQVLGTLQLADREMHARVPRGAKLRVESVDTERNRCTVSLL